MLCHMVCEFKTVTSYLVLEKRVKCVDEKLHELLSRVDSVLEYKYKYNKNVQVQVQVQVQGFAKCTSVLPKYISNVLGYNYQVPSTNV